MTMHTVTAKATEPSFGTNFVHLFEVNADRFQMLAQKPTRQRECEYLNRPYELSDLMRLATAAGVWPPRSC
jgi:hypothetical protein